MPNGFISPIDRTLPGATSPGQSGPGSNDNEVPQSSTAGASPLDCLMSYSGHSLVGKSYPTTEMQSVYSTAPANWAMWKNELKKR